MLWECSINFKGNLDDHQPFIEFSYNISYHSTISMPPFEALYGRRYRFPVGYEVGEFFLHCPDLVKEAPEKVRVKRDTLKTTQS